MYTLFTFTIILMVIDIAIAAYRPWRKKFYGWLRRILLRKDTYTTVWNEVALGFAILSVFICGLSCVLSIWVAIAVAIAHNRIIIHIGKIN